MRPADPTPKNHGSATASFGVSADAGWLNTTASCCSATCALELMAQPA
jgi:hypothetical protein